MAVGSYLQRDSAPVGTSLVTTSKEFALTSALNSECSIHRHEMGFIFCLESVTITFNGLPKFAGDKIRKFLTFRSSGFKCVTLEYLVL